MKRTIKLASVLLLIAVISMTLTTMVSANGGIDAANIAGGLKGTTSNAQNDVTKIGNQLIGIITTVGVVVAVIILLVLGIKYMMGNDNDTTITDLHTYHIAYNVAAKQMTLAIAHHNKQ